MIARNSHNHGMMSQAWNQCFRIKISQISLQLMTPGEYGHDIH